MLSTPTKMNVFLQRMLRKSDDECEDETVMETNHQQPDNLPRGKSNWMHKFSASPKYKSFSVKSVTPPMQRTAPPAIHRAATFPTAPQDAPDLGNIIKEFEINYLSPTKQITQQELDKTGKFVKKMVAAFEQKYSSKNKSIKQPENDAVDNRWKRRSLPPGSSLHQEARKNFFNETYVKTPAPVATTIPVQVPEPASAVLDDTLDVTLSCSDLDETLDVSATFAMDEDLSSTPLRPPQDLTPEYPTVVEMPSFLDDSCQLSDLSGTTPKIVGAFLKKPIEVEDTSIDWIPITGKKLPRKHSFKKLLSILTGRKSSNKDKGSKLFCSQSHNNLHEEPKEHQDSGYEERSSSTSSLTSLASFSEIVHHQDSYPTEPYQRSSVSTFRAPETKEPLNSPDPIRSHSQLEDLYSDTSSICSRKFIFEEIPRSEVRLSLGPSFPLKNLIMRQASGSSIASADLDLDLDVDVDLDLDFDLDEENESPIASPLPKHPFVSSMDDLDKEDVNSSNSSESSELSENSSQDVTQIEFRRPYRKPENDSCYDIPRSYLSRSDPGLSNISRSSTCSFDAPVYDIPTIKLPPRPKSSVYEDALSLKRRNANVSSVVTTVRSQFYAFESEEEPHYATVKPRNIKILPSKDLLRSMANVSPNCRTPVSHYLAFNRLAGF